MSVERSHALILGRDFARTWHYLVVAMGLFGLTLGSMGLIWFAGQQNITLPIDGAWLLWAMAVIIVGIPAIHAYQNDGLLVCIALGTAVPLAFYLVLRTYNLVYPSEDLLWGIGTALQFGIPAGSVGFLLGVGVRRLRQRNATAGSGLPC